MSDHIDETYACWVLAEIRQILGVGEKPELSELPGILRQRLEDDREAITIAYLQGAEDMRKRSEKE